MSTKMYTRHLHDDEFIKLIRIELSYALKFVRAHQDCNIYFLTEGEETETLFYMDERCQH